MTENSNWSSILNDLSSETLGLLKKFVDEVMDGLTQEDAQTLKLLAEKRRQQNKNGD